MNKYICTPTHTSCHAQLVAVEQDAPTMALALSQTQVAHLQADVDQQQHQQQRQQLGQKPHADGGQVETINGQLGHLQARNVEAGHGVQRIMVGQVEVCQKKQRVFIETHANNPPCSRVHFCRGTMSTKQLMLEGLRILQLRRKLRKAGKPLCPGLLEKAAEMFRAVLAIDPQNASAHTNLGYVLMKLGDEDGALTALHAAVAIDPLAPNANQNLSALLLMRGDFAGAEECLRTIVSAAPGNALAHYNLAVCLVKRGDKIGAAAAYQAVLNARPKGQVRRQTVNNLTSLGTSLLCEGSMESAESAYRATIAANRPCPEANFNLGLIVEARKDYGSAADLFATVVQHAPELAPQAQQHMTQMLEAAHKQAGEAITAAVEIARAAAQAAAEAAAQAQQAVQLAEAAERIVRQQQRVEQARRTVEKREQWLAEQPPAKAPRAAAEKPQKKVKQLPAAPSCAELHQIAKAVAKDKKMKKKMKKVRRAAKQ